MNVWILMLHLEPQSDENGSLQGIHLTLEGALEAARKEADEILDDFDGELRADGGVFSVEEMGGIFKYHSCTIKLGDEVMYEWKVTLNPVDD